MQSLSGGRADHLDIGCVVRICTGEVAGKWPLVRFASSWKTRHAKGSPATWQLLQSESAGRAERTVAKFSFNISTGKAAPTWAVETDQETDMAVGAIRSQGLNRRPSGRSVLLQEASERSADAII